MPPAGFAEPRWYAAYTCSRHEKHVAMQLGQKQIQHFLPLYLETHRWKDRRKAVQVALFPGYVFVRSSLENRLPILTVNGIVRLVGFGGRPAPLADEDIDSLRRGTTAGVRIEPHPYLTAGRRVRIVRGPLAGTTGILQRRKEGLRVIVSIDMIMRSVAAEVDEDDIAVEC